MTTLSQDQLLSIVAKFMNEANPGDRLLLPANTELRVRGDGRLMMGRNGSLWTLFNETSDDIVHKIVRWEKENQHLSNVFSTQKRQVSI